MIVVHILSIIVLYNDIFIIDSISIWYSEQNCEMLFMEYDEYFVFRYVYSIYGKYEIDVLNQVLINSVACVFLTCVHYVERREGR